MFRGLGGGLFNLEFGVGVPAIRGFEDQSRAMGCTVYCTTDVHVLFGSSFQGWGFLSIASHFRA